MKKSLFILLCFCTSCIALLDSSNFGDEIKLKRLLLDETWQIERMHVEEAERDNYAEPFTITLDSLIAVSGSMYFAKDSDKGRRDFIYTDANGIVTEGVFIIESDVENDNPTIQFDIEPKLFPDPHRAFNKFKVLTIDDHRIELIYTLEGTGSRTRYQYSLDLVK